MQQQHYPSSQQATADSQQPANKALYLPLKQ